MVVAGSANPSNLEKSTLFFIFQIKPNSDQTQMDALDLVGVKLLS